MSDFSLLLVNPPPATPAGSIFYASGDSIRAQLRIFKKEPSAPLILKKGLEVHLMGEHVWRYETTSTTTNSDGTTSTSTTTHYDRTNIVHLCTHLVPATTQINAGEHIFSFDWTLPDALPPSVDGNPRVHYEIRAVGSKDCCMPILVAGWHEGVHQEISALSLPSSLRFSKSFLGDEGQILVEMMSPTSRAIRGTTIKDVSMTVENKSKQKIVGAKFTFPGSSAVISPSRFVCEPGENALVVIDVPIPEDALVNMIFPLHGQPGMLCIELLIEAALRFNVRCSGLFAVIPIWPRPPHDSSAGFLPAPYTFDCNRRGNLGPSGILPMLRWNDDNSSKVCTICSAEFGILKRRHHCRACGSLACDSCTPKLKNPPALLSDSPVRVCVSCRANNDEFAKAKK